MNNRATFFEGRIIGEDQGLKIEEDHELVWFAPDEALRRLRHDPTPGRWRHGFGASIPDRSPSQAPIGGNLC